MTQAELTFYELVPKALREIAKELKTLNDHFEKAQMPDTQKTSTMKYPLEPYWDAERGGVFIPFKCTRNGYYEDERDYEHGDDEMC